MIALVAITVSAIGLLNYRSLEQALLPRVLDRIESQSRLVAADLEAYVAGARGDVASLRAGVALNGLMRAREAGGTDPVDGISEKAWRERIAARLVGRARSQARLCRDPRDRRRRQPARDRARRPPRPERRDPDRSRRATGAEGRPDPISRKRSSCSPAKSTSRRSRWTGSTGPSSMPHGPTLRVATPVFTPDGKPFGIFIINVDMRPAFDRVRASARPGENVYLINERGDYLVHPDRAREFGSVLGKPTENWQSDFPALASSIGATAKRRADRAGSERTARWNSAGTRHSGRQRMGRGDQDRAEHRRHDDGRRHSEVRPCWSVWSRCCARRCWRCGLRVR